jgi:hypothetical protein
VVGIVGTDNSQGSNTIQASNNSQGKGDVPPPGNTGTCQEQQQWGKCNEGWMKGFCCQTCGGC